MQTSIQKHRVLILCTGNAFRSQMAEALVNHFLGDRWQAFSAGTFPARAVHPVTLQVLEEIGIHHRGAPKPIDHFYGQAFDVVITVCEDAAENCPVWLGAGKRVHMGFPDLGEPLGNQTDWVEAARMVRDDMRQRLLGYLQTLPVDQAAE